jgi:hypothetical protein
VIIHCLDSRMRIKTVDCAQNSFRPGCCLSAANRTSLELSHLYENPANAERNVLCSLRDKLSWGKSAA